MFAKRQKNACPFIRAGYTIHMRIFFGSLFLLMALTARANADTTNQCLVRLDQLVELVDELAQSASNDTGRAICITENLTKIKEIAKIAHALAATDPIQSASGRLTAADSNRNSMIQLACTRAEKLLTFAADCRETSRTNDLIPEVKVAISSNAAPAVSNPIAPVLPRGDDDTCLIQIKLAGLLAQALNWDLSADAALQKLTKQSIEPLGGWRAERCVTLGDFCVVIARLLNLKVKVPDDPASYIQVVRNDGLPVDGLAARHPQEALHESEVRAFLGRGYAAPLPSSRVRQPD